MGTEARIFQILNINATNLKVTFKQATSSSRNIAEIKKYFSNKS